MRSTGELPPTSPAAVPLVSGNVLAVPVAVTSTAPGVRPTSGRHRLPLRAGRAFSEALFSTGEAPPPRERIDWLMREVDDVLVHAGWRSTGVYKLVLMAVALLAPPFIGRLRPLWSLSLPQRVEALTRMEHSALGAVVLAAKSLICLLYYEHPDAAREIGHVPRRVSEVKP